MKKLITDIDISQKSVLLRTDFNVPLKDGAILSTKRIDASFATIDYLISKQCKIVIATHLGRPTGFDINFSLRPVFLYLKKRYGDLIKFSSDVAGPNSKEIFKTLRNGEILLMENVRFDDGEEQGDLLLAKRLSEFGEIFVNDAFATAHRKHASTYMIAKYLPSVAGLLMGGEVNSIKEIIDAPQKPYVALVGGAKVKDKIKMLTALATNASQLLIGGAMAQTFLYARGKDVGASLVDMDGVEFAKELLANHNNIILPVDFVVMDKSGDVRTTSMISASESVFDIGTVTAKLFCDYIKQSKTVVMNGPVGMFEESAFENGTKQVCQALAACNGKVLVGGGDSAAAYCRFADPSSITHLSTGGGATLKMLEGTELPCISVLEDKS